MSSNVEWTMASQNAKWTMMLGRQEAKRKSTAAAHNPPAAEAGCFDFEVGCCGSLGGQKQRTRGLCGWE
jgi:hypothetical protein